MSLASTVKKLSVPREVTRRTAATYDGTSPRPSAAGVDLTAVVALAIQRQPPTTLVRDFDGDESGGAARVWVTTAALSAAYDVTDEDDPPAALGWTELQIAPPEDADGPPGDVIAWEGRRWEITEFQGWDVAFRGPPRFMRYKATDRGASS
jgi:hypothetical protein